MAFHIRNFSVLQYANGFTMWHYRTDDDALAAVDELGYFADVEGLISRGDMIAVSAADGGAMRFVQSIVGPVVEALKP